LTGVMTGATVTLPGT
jgi:hypothetical protein